MKIAQKLREKNIAEYLIYMWQVEDLLRANGCDMERIHSNIVSKYPEADWSALDEWYAGLLEMMRDEGVMRQGHLQVNRNVIIRLTELHAALLSSPKYPRYNAAYFRALPFIVELRQRNGDKDESEIETCFEALYGVLMLRLQGREVSQATAKAIEVISNFISMLAGYYAKNRDGSIELET